MVTVKVYQRQGRSMNIDVHINKVLGKRYIRYYHTSTAKTACLYLKRVSLVINLDNTTGSSWETDFNMPRPNTTDQALTFQILILDYLFKRN